MFIFVIPGITEEMKAVVKYAQSLEIPIIVDGEIHGFDENSGIDNCDNQNTLLENISSRKEQHRKSSYLNDFDGKYFDFNDFWYELKENLQEL